MLLKIPCCIVAVGVAVACFVSERQRRKLRKLTPCKAPAVEQDALGAYCTILDGRAGLQFYVRRWDPATPEDVKAVLMIMHGLTQHSGTFAEAAKFFRSKGVAVVAYDMYSYGLSGGLGGVPGVHVVFQDWVDQATEVLRISRTEWYPGVPVFPFGESFGAVVATAWCTKHPEVQDQLAGLILSGAPAKLPPELLPPMHMLAVYKLLGRMFPLLHLPDEKITDQEHFATSFGDPSWAEKIWNDPLMVKKTFLGTLGGCLDNTLQLLPRASSITNIPVMVMHGHIDTRTLYAGAVELFDELGSNDKQLKSYGGMRHHLLHGAPQDVELVVNDVLEWIMDRC